MLILWPLFAMVLLTFVVIFRLGKMRVAAVRSQRVNHKFYLTYRGYDEPDDLVTTSRHLINLFETPTLFYVVGILIFVTEQTSLWLVLLSWAYVLVRYMHAFVHMTSNRLLIRYRVFLISLLFLALIWIVFAVQLVLT